MLSIDGVPGAAGVLPECCRVLPGCEDVRPLPGVAGCKGLWSRVLRRGHLDGRCCRGRGGRIKYPWMVIASSYACSYVSEI